MCNWWNQKPPNRNWFICKCCQSKWVRLWFSVWIYKKIQIRNGFWHAFDGGYAGSIDKGINEQVNIIDWFDETLLICLYRQISCARRYVLVHTLLLSSYMLCSDCTHYTHLSHTMYSIYVCFCAQLQFICFRCGFYRLLLWIASYGRIHSWGWCVLYQNETNYSLFSSDDDDPHLLLHET